MTVFRMALLLRLNESIKRNTVIQLFIVMRVFLLTLMFLRLAVLGQSAALPADTAAGLDASIKKQNTSRALSCIDKAASVLYFVAQDGRRVYAIDSNTGSIIGSKDPFDDWGLKPYRVSYPVIVSLKLVVSKLTGANLLQVTFDSSQFGIIDFKNDRTYFGGQE
jgi:hypothetical protein